MTKLDRKAAIAAYKETAKSVAGIYAVRCSATGAVWIGESRNLGAQQTSLWFVLRQGSHPNRTLMAAAAAHGLDSFSFEVLEKLGEDETGTLQRALLKQKSTAWIAELGAQRL